MQPSRHLAPGNPGDLDEGETASKLASPRSRFFFSLTTPSPESGAFARRLFSTLTGKECDSAKLTRPIPSHRDIIDDIVSSKTKTGKGRRACAPATVNS